MKTTSQEKSTIAMADAICDAFFGPSPYRGVAMLRHAAESCAERGLCAECTRLQDKWDFSDAAKLLLDLADDLDLELIQKAVL